MIKHIVLWKVKDSYQGKNKEELIQNFKAMLENLKSIIPEIKKIEVGLNLSSSLSALDVALYSEFETKEGLDSYRKHPEHQKVAEYAKKITVSGSVVDYQV
ncbi:MAG: Dabb family protein [Candidatus Omnitrophica bacterium]|nr:Dabb family protein [Candidatus Omnitrophota bacterium]